MRRSCRPRTGTVGGAWSNRRVSGPERLADHGFHAPRLVRQAPVWGPEPVWDAPARRALDHVSGPLRVFGGPGTGKTTLLLAAVARRIRAGVDPERILLLVGSRRAADE